MAVCDFLFGGGDNRLCNIAVSYCRCAGDECSGGRRMCCDIEVAGAATVQKTGCYCNYGCGFIFLEDYHCQLTELEQLKIWGRISKLDYKKAVKSWKKSHATVIDFKNRLLSDAFGKACIKSMEKHHGVSKEDIANDCNILVSTLKNDVDLFLSEDFHFTSEITKEVINEVKSAACTEFHQMCDSVLYSIDAETFLDAYNGGNIDIDVIQSHIKSIRKSGKRL